MNILHGSLFIRKWKFRGMLLLASLNLWLNQMFDILIGWYKEALVQRDWFFDESWVGKLFNDPEAASSFDPYWLLYWILIVVGVYFWIQIAYAAWFAVADMRNQKGKRTGTKFTYILIGVINIAVYIFLITQIYNPIG